MDEYATSFTVHGVSRIYTGNIIEKVLWSIFVLTAVTGSVIVLSNYAQKHLKYEVIQAFTSQAITRAYYPQVTFCLDNLRYALVRLHCGVDFEKIVNHTDCENDGLACSVPKRKIKGIWSNGLFNVRYVGNGNKHYYDSSNLDNYLNGHENDAKGICATWHFNKSFYQILSSAYYNPFSIELEIAEDLVDRATKAITVIINEQNIASIFQTAQLRIVPEFDYHLQLSKTVTYRKEKPFPSNCAHHTNINGFPGVYNRETCLLINNDLEVFKKYGITRDISRHFIRKNIKSKYKKNWHNEVYGFRNAFFEFFNNIDLENSICPLPRHEVKYGFSVTTIPATWRQKPYQYPPEQVEIDEVAGKRCFNLRSDNKLIGFLTYRLYLHYQDPHIFTKIEEKELYPRYEMLGDIGGFLGLMIGASCISALELIAFVVMATIKKCCK